MKCKYIFFDVANTLLYKSDLFDTIIKTLNEFGIDIDKSTLIKRHKIVSEIIIAPNKTSREFYDHFNSEILYSLGIIPKRDILESIYKNCQPLPWNKFEDTEILKESNVSIGIISNWDHTLPDKLAKLFNFKFDKVVFSSEVQLSKPNAEIFVKALSEIEHARKEIMYVGDSIRLDMEPALKLGLNTVLIDRNNIYPNFPGQRIESLSQIKDLLNKEL